MLHKHRKTSLKVVGVECQAIWRFTCSDSCPEYWQSAVVTALAESANAQYVHNKSQTQTFYTGNEVKGMLMSWPRRLAFL